MRNRTLSPGAIYLGVTALLLCLLTCCLSDDSITAQFTDDENHLFNHIAQDSGTGNLFIGAVNVIYELSSQLTKLKTLVTGPEPDNFRCRLGQCSFTKTLTDNYNKILIVDRQRQWLIVCGSLFQGVCQIRNLSNIDYILRNQTEPVAANNASASTVGFLAPGPRGGTVLVVGATVATHIDEKQVYVSPYWDKVPAVSSRKLENTSALFKFVAKDTLSETGTYVGFQSGHGYEQTYQIRYIHGFNSDGFHYLLTVQKHSLDDNLLYVSKIVQVCERDLEYKSFTELLFKCSDENVDYNLLQAATVGKVGQELARKLNLSVHEDVLLGIFSKNASGAGMSAIPSAKAALCLYRLGDIKKVFSRNKMRCSKGEGSSPAWIRSQDCFKVLFKKYLFY